MAEGDLTFCKWKRREQTLLHQPLAVSSACHCRDVMVGLCCVLCSGNLWVVRGLLSAERGRKRQKGWFDQLLSRGVQRKHYSVCLLPPPSGKLPLLQQVQFLAKVQHCTNFQRERRREGEKRRVPHKGGATMSQAPFGQKPNCCKEEKNW